MNLYVETTVEKYAEKEQPADPTPDTFVLSRQEVLARRRKQLIRKNKLLLTLIKKVA